MIKNTIRWGSWLIHAVLLTLFLPWEELNTFQTYLAGVSMFGWGISIGGYYIVLDEKNHVVELLKNVTRNRGHHGSH